MGLYLIAMASLSWLIPWLWNLFLVIVALGMVIFVHELGHFVVAKLAGVRVDKFYLGFDIGGWKLARFRWGETEYGIGVFPLGGYVKMLGQEDNPGRLREELERARLNPPSADSAGDADLGGTTVTEAEAALYHPRSYLAKSVPARMAIISAGVIMNLIFAFVVAVAAFWFGVEQVACGVGQVSSGESAWRAGLRPGDEILEIAGKRTTLFRDLMAAISVGDVQDGVPILIRRPGVSAPFTLTVFPDQTRGKPTVGVTPPESLNLWTGAESPVAPGSAAAEAKPPFQQGDQVIAVGGATVKYQAEWEAQLAQHVAEPLKIQVLRPGVREARGQEQQELTIQVPPQPIRDLGLTIDDGPLVAIQNGSPAEKAGLKTGDRIEQIDGQPAGDPLRWEDRFRGRVGQEVKLGVRRASTKTVETVTITPRPANWLEPPILLNSPLSVPALGIAVRMGNQVVDVAAGGPAASAGLRSGDVLIRAELVPPPGIKDRETAIKARPLELGDQQRNWPLFFYFLQDLPKGTAARLTTSDKRTVDLQPVDARNWFNPERGMRFERRLITEQADSAGQAMRLGWRETADSTMLVFRVLGKLGTQISPRELSGPVEIFKAASQAAQEGMTRLFLFLTMLSANLAVVNFLPIPVLDGGHMLFLAYEGIRGKPASERVQLVLTYAGLFFILGLMVFVIGLDLGLISRAR